MGEHSLYRIALLALIAAFGTTVGNASAAPTPFPNGLRCGLSPYAYGDILPERDNRPGTWVVSISKILMGGKTVGYVYNMKDGVRLVQGTYDMPVRILNQLHTTALAVRQLHAPLPSSLRIVPCPKSELTTRPKQH